MRARGSIWGLAHLVQGAQDGAVAMVSSPRLVAALVTSAVMVMAACDRSRGGSSRRGSRVRHEGHQRSLQVAAPGVAALLNQADGFLRSPKLLADQQRGEGPEVRGVLRTPHIVTRHELQGGEVADAASPSTRAALPPSVVSASMTFARESSSRLIRDEATARCDRPRHPLPHPDGTTTRPGIGPRAPLRWQRETRGAASAASSPRRSRRGPGPAAGSTPRSCFEHSSSRCTE